MMAQMIFCASVRAQSVNTITIYDHYPSSTTSVVNRSLLPKSQRKSQATGGNIKVTFLDNVEDSVAQAIHAATELWESYLPIGVEVPIEVAFAPIANEMQLTISYLSEGDTLYCSPYYTNYINTSVDVGNYLPIVTFSSSVNWSCRYDGAANGTYSLTTAMLRGIAMALGFGTTVVQRGGTRSGECVFFDTNRADPYTPFEYRVYDTANHSLSGITKGKKERENAVLRAFSEQGSNSVKFFASDGQSYSLYTPNSFETNKSMIFLDNDNSLMHHLIPRGSLILNIDTITLNILREIGWKLQSPSVTDITCPTIPVSGVASAYVQHQFSIVNYSVAMSSLKWSCLMRQSDGDYHVASQQNGGTTFSISPSTFSFQSPNTDGDLDCIVELSYILGGSEHKIQKHLSFELSPSIIDITDQTVHLGNHTTLYDYSLNIRYAGATDVTIGVEQEYSSYYRIIHVSEPYLAHAYISSLNRGNYVWLDISVSNAYGSDTRTIEIPEQSLSSHQLNNRIDNAVHGSTKVAQIDVCSQDGTKLKTVNNINGLESLTSGNYILVYKDLYGKIVKTRKIHK